LRKYELTYLVSDVIPEADLNKVTGKVSGFIVELGGKMAKEDIWGRRKLAYPIKKQDFATYVTVYFDLPAQKAIEFEKDLRHIDGVLRHLMLVTEYGQEALTLTKEEIADVEEIAEVAGGEAAVEAVEGEAKEEIKEEEPATEEKVEEEKSSSAKATEDASAEEPAEAKVAEIKEKPAKGIEKEQKAEPKEAKIKKAPAKKKKEKASDEAERLSKLNEELDDILKDEL